MHQSALVLEKRQEHTEKTKKEFSEFISLKKLNSSFFVDQMNHGMSMKK